MNRRKPAKAGRNDAASLGELELTVLLAVLQAGEEAYPVSIRDAIEDRAGRRVSRAAVFITLERLERKGLVSSWYGEPTPVRGGRSKRFFRVEEAGVAAVRQALDALTSLAAGLDSVLAAE